MASDNGDVDAYTKQSLERLKLRQDVKDILKDVDGVKNLLSDVKSSKFGIVVQRLKDVCSKLEYARELTLDAACLKELSFALEKQASTMSSLSRRHDFDSIANRFVLKFTPETDNVVDWTTAGVQLGRLINFCVPVTTMVGPLSKEEKVRKVAVRKPREAPETGAIQKPQEMTEENADKDEATNGRVLKLHDEAITLNEQADGRGFDLLKLLIDPVDPVQSVENLFDFSFLMKEKMVAVGKSGGLPMASITIPEDIDERKIKKQQMVLSINMKDLEEMTKLLYGEGVSEADIHHPLHRNDEIYKSHDARQQADFLEKRKKRKTA